MSVSPTFLFLLVTLFCASALDEQQNHNIREELWRLKTEIGKLETEVKDLRNLKQRLGKVDALESEVKQLRWLLKQQKVDRSKYLIMNFPSFLLSFNFFISVSFLFTFFLSKQLLSLQRYCKHCNKRSNKYVI